MPFIFCSRSLLPTLNKHNNEQHQARTDSDLEQTAKTNSPQPYAWSLRGFACRERITTQDVVAKYMELRRLAATILRPPTKLYM